MNLDQFYNTSFLCGTLKDLADSEGKSGFDNAVL